MERYPFKSHRIERSCKETFNSYSDYKPYLEKDFSNHCCYCNMLATLGTDSFHVEHFIPKKIFSGKKDYLLTDYNNLMLSCPKCNLSKGDAYDGDLEHDDSITNSLFYNPIETDYNTIFYRNRIGGIQSDDAKGKYMIQRLKLYRPVHNLAWICEEYDKIISVLEEKAKLEINPEKKKSLEELIGKLSAKCRKLEKKFRLAYAGKLVPPMD